MMNDVAGVQEPVVLHEKTVPDEMSRGVHKHQQLEVVDLLTTCSVILCNVPVKSHQESNDTVIYLDQAMSEDELIVWLGLFHHTLWEGVVKADYEEHTEPENVGGDHVCYNFRRHLLCSWQREPSGENFAHFKM